MASPQSDHADLPARLSLQLVASLVACCRGKVPRLIYDGKLPPPGPDGCFDREAVFLSPAWRARRARHH